MSTPGFNIKRVEIRDSDMVTMTIFLFHFSMYENCLETPENKCGHCTAVRVSQL